MRALQTAYFTHNKQTTQYTIVYGNAKKDLVVVYNRRMQYKMYQTKFICPVYSAVYIVHCTLYSVQYIHYLPLYDYFSFTIMSTFIKVHAPIFEITTSFN